MERVILISGSAKHGKTSTAEILERELKQMGKKVFVSSFDDYLVYIATRYFDYVPNLKDEPTSRKILQEVDTEICRKQDPNFWVNVVKNLIVALSDEFDYCIVDGAQFPSDIDTLKKQFNVTTIQVLRRNFDNCLGDRKTHVSENALNFYDFDYYVNSETLQELNSKLRSILNKLDIG